MIQSFQGTILLGSPLLHLQLFFTWLPASYSYLQKKMVPQVLPKPPALNWVFVYPQNSPIETLLPKILILECGAFGRELGLDEVMKLGPSWWD